MPGTTATPSTRARDSLSNEAPGLILLVDDEPLMLRALVRTLEPDGHRVVTAETTEAAEVFLRDPDLDVIVLDLVIRGASGREFLDRIKRERPEVEVVVATGHASVTSAVECMRQGAFDYLAKPFDDVPRVRSTVRRALERRRLVRRNRELEQQLRGGRASRPDLVGESPAMRGLVRVIESLRENQSNVLIQGESGTGKELVARAIHATSGRSEGPFVPVDCGALPETIIESELFGHERGAFTGALGAPGLFRRAENGTLFLDEIGEVPAHMQAKLLRALQQKEVRPVGAAEALPVDIRVVSATHRNLVEMAERDAFRMDLFYRLNVVRIEIPALRQRREDIPLLVHHFLNKHRREHGPLEGISDDALAFLVERDWPGNVRELENVIESALALAPGRRLRLADLPVARGNGARVPAPTARVPLSLKAYERCALERALAEARGDVNLAARLLGIGRSTFYRKLSAHGLRDAEGGGRISAIR